MALFSPVCGYPDPQRDLTDQYCSMDVTSITRMGRRHRDRRRLARLHSRRYLRLLQAAAVLATVAVLSGAARLPDAHGPWVWPVEGARQITDRFHAPAHDYGPGHRGIDLKAAIGTAVRAPADGVVAFRGVVVDRPLITIDHGGGIVTTFAPVTSTLNPGSVVAVGEEIGIVGTGGHSPAGEMHLGVRWRDVYINPLLLFGDVPRAILLPCCA